MAKQVISTTSAPAAIGPYSQAIEIGGMLFVSGQIGINPTNGQIEAKTIEGQTEQVMKNIKAILSEAGYTMSDIVRTSCMLSDISNFAAFNEEYGKHLSAPFPARSTFAVKDLPKGALVEVEVTAVRK
ncbi:MAG: RidA family protein [Bacteroidales bacterium]|jgi:2-iminobutanoate/2-iminopropanoate deaminase|nr:RidA family protein [Bacteroidales bacterium]